MIKSIIGGVAAAALLSGPALAAPAKPTAKPSGLTWVVIPTETGCRTDLELIGRSGGVTPVSLISDGQLVSLRFFKDDLPTRAFLPVRVDRARFSNLMLRGTDGAGELVLSEETEAAMKRGSTLDIAWLAAEPLSVSLLTVELLAEGGGTRLVLTEQGAYFGDPAGVAGREQGLVRGRQQAFPEHLFLVGARKACTRRRFGRRGGPLIGTSQAAHVAHRLAEGQVVVVPIVVHPVLQRSTGHAMKLKRGFQYSSAPPAFMNS